eukprot:scaffold23528_cov83-Phaeocystis_antarctica.AAC.2
MSASALPIAMDRNCMVPAQVSAMPIVVLNRFAADASAVAQFVLPITGTLVNRPGVSVHAASRRALP